MPPDTGPNSIHFDGCRYFLTRRAGGFSWHGTQFALTVLSDEHLCCTHAMGPIGRFIGNPSLQNLEN